MRDALEHLSGVQAQLGLPSRTPAVVPFWGRPYLQVDRSLVPALMATIEDPVVRARPVGVGAIEQHTDSVDILSHAPRRLAVAAATAAASAEPPLEQQR